MKNRLLLSSFIVLAMMLVLSPFTRAEVPPLPPECKQQPLAVNDPKTPEEDFQLVLICVPENWNRSLVIYAHGFVPPQPQFPLVLPINELTIDNTFLPQLLLAQGFAFTTSSYHKNGAVTQQAIDDLLDLLNFFQGSVGLPSHVFIIGGSEGGLTAIQLLEQHPDQFAGGLALCAPVGGAPHQIKYLGDFRVVFDYFFPDVFSFGAFNVPLEAFKQWDTYVTQIIAEMTNHVGATAQLFSVTRAAVDPSSLTTFISTAVETALDLLFYSIWETPDLVATGGGIPYENRFRLYVGLTNNLALNHQVERVKSDPEAERYARMFYQTKGNLERPLVTLHNLLDPIVPFDHELIYRGLVAGQQKSRFLTAIPVPGYGHCEFTTAQVLGAFGTMIQQAMGFTGP